MDKVPDSKAARVMAATVEVGKAAVEYVEYIQIWSLSPASALACFGFTEATHEISVLQFKPTDPRDVQRYSPDAKLYGIKRKAV